MLITEPSFQIAPSRAHWTVPLDGMCRRTGVSLPEATGERVEIAPRHAVRRRAVQANGLAVEIVQSTQQGRMEHRFCAPVHLLIVCEQGAREEGETGLGDLPPSTLRSLTRKLIFVPAGQTFREWHEVRSPMRLIYLYLDPAAVERFAPGQLPLRPRLFFEDKTLLDSALKLKALVESGAAEGTGYFEALGAVLMHELIRLDRGAPRSESPIRGGLAAWQQRAVTAYIEEHLAEPIRLPTLAQLARLSPHYFCRAFKQSFGLPPHRYHLIRRIERAKALLAGEGVSVTEIGLKLGFSETSAFSTAFRKATGMTPTAYCRGLD